MLLAIDTSAGTAVAVIDADGRVLAERGAADGRRHAELIGPFIAETMAEAGAAPGGILAVAVGMGPGPFTGLRVGIAAARAYAFGIARPLIPIVSHDAVAYAAARDGRREPLLVVTDARRREVAWSRYDAPDPEGLPRRVAGPALADAARFGSGSGFGSGPADDFGPAFRIDAEQMPAAALGLLAQALVDRGRPLGPAQPLYLREPDVTLSEPKRVSG